MLAALLARMPRGVTWTRPEGGLFVWLTLPEGMDSEALLMPAVEAGVAYVAGGPFHVDGSGANTLRLTFAKESPERIAEGVRRLASVVEQGIGG
jgi:DNA-binding transcriptional MocR family regulator